MQTQLTHSTLTQTDLPTPLEQLIPEALQAVLREEIVVPRERLELSLLSKTDFESAASTDSATEARWARSIGRRPGVVNRATGMASGAAAGGKAGDDRQDCRLSSRR